MKKLILSLFILCSACSSKPVVMTKDDVKVSRETPSAKCKELGKVTGASSSVSAKVEQNIIEMKNEAAAKGANYVQILSVGQNTQTVTGLAFDCP